MVVALSPNEPFTYVCKADRELPEEQQTRWSLVALTVAQRALLEDEAAAGEIGEEEVRSVRFRTGSINLKSIQSGLRGVENFLDRSGSAVPFEAATKKLNVLGVNVLPPSDRFLERIPSAVITELAEAIREGSRLSVDEGKD